MSIDYLTDFQKNTGCNNSNKYQNSIFNSRNLKINTNIYAMEYSSIEEELKYIYNSNKKVSIEKCEIIILSEPWSREQTPEEISEFKRQYLYTVKIAKEKDIPILHLVTNERWYFLFQHIIKEYDINVFIPQSLQNLLNLPEKEIMNVKEYINIDSIVNYSN